MHVQERVRHREKTRAKLKGKRQSRCWIERKGYTVLVRDYKYALKCERAKDSERKGERQRRD